jgi:predicted TPR repeat methyltransferase
MGAVQGLDLQICARAAESLDVSALCDLGCGTDLLIDGLRGVSRVLTGSTLPHSQDEDKNGEDADGSCE